MVDRKVRPPPAENRVGSVARHACAVLLATTALGVVSAHAVSGTWVGGNGGDPSEWVEPANWSSAAVPDATATFTSTGVTTVANDNGVVFVGLVQFVPGAQAYTVNINNPFIVNAQGIINNSANPQTFNISSGNALVFQNGSTAGGGTGLVTLNNQSGGFINFQNTSTAGSATIVNNSILQFADTSTAASANVANNVETDFFDAASAGSAIITNAVTGTLTFNNTATASAAALTNGGNLQFNGASNAGHANIANANGATLGFFTSSSAGSATITNNVGGAMSFNDTSTAGNAGITNNATLAFNNASTGASATITNNIGGAMSFNDTSTAGNAAIANNATLVFNNASTAGNASIVNISGATIDFNGTSAATAAIGNAGTLSFNALATAAGAHITNTGGGFLAFNGSSTAGGAAITNNAGGTTQFFNTSTAGNATITNVVNGITQFLATSTASSASINNNGGLTQFNGSSTAGAAVITTNSGGGVFFVGTSGGGQATFVTNTGGVFDMSGLTSAGTTAGSIAGAGNYFLGSKTLTVGGNNLSTAVSGVISDGGLSGGTGGALTKTGTATLTLSGINTYTGATMVNGGMLIVDGSTALSALTTVNAGGILSGSGTVGNTAIAGGTLAPGSTGGSIFGPLTVQGNLSFTAASTYMIQISPANAGRTNVMGVAGAATPGGATVNAVFLPGSFVDHQYTIVHATGGVSGTFNPAVVSNMPNLQSTLSYGANDAFLNIKLVFVPPPSGTLSVNQQNVANAITGFFNSGGRIPAAFAALNAGGLTIASGELGAGVIQSSIKADDLFLNLLLDPSVAGRAGGLAPGGAASQFAADDTTLAYGAKRRASRGERDAYAMATKAPPMAAEPLDRWSVWGAAYGGSEIIGGNAVVGSHDTTARVYGVVAGADYKVTPDSLLGFALAGGGTSFWLANGLGSGSSDLFQAGAFARHNFGEAYLAAALAYGWQDVTTNRAVALALAGGDQLQGRFRANTFSGRFEGGYRFATPMVGITPYAAAQVVRFDLPAYAEQSLAGGGVFALNYAAQTTTDTRTELGLRGDKSFAMHDAMLTLRGRAAWAHDYNPASAVTAIFQALPGASFVVNGARPNPDSALVSAGAETKWRNGFSLAATFEGELSSNTTSYSGKGVARYTW